MKDLHEDNIFGSVRERLGRYEEAPSEGLWDRIASQKRKRVLWPVWLAASTAVVIVTGFLVSGFESDPVTNKVEPTVVKNEASETKQVLQTIGVKETHSSIKASHSESKTDRSEEAQPTIVAQPETRNSKLETFETIEPLKTNESKDSTNVSKPIEVIPPYKKPKSKFQFYLSVTPSLSFQKIIPGGDDNIIIQGLANRSPFSMKRFGFAIDIGTQYELNKYFGFYGGVSFYRQQQQITYNYYDKDATVTRSDDSWTFVIDRPVHSKTFDYTMTNVGAQGGVMVTLKGDKLKNKFGAGLNYMQSLNTSASYIAYQVFYRNEVRINERFSWFVQPMFTYSFIAKEKLNEPFTLKPYRAGISGGVLYRFK